MHNDSMNSSGCSGIWWWATLVVAVVAVPVVGFIAASLVPVRGIGEIIVFVLTCWTCTFLGMKLMQHPAMSKKIINRK